MSEPETSSELSYGGSLASLSTPESSTSSEQVERSAPESAPVESTASADAPAARAQGDSDDADPIEKATNLDELKAALRKRSPNKKDRSDIEAQLARSAEYERRYNDLVARQQQPAKPETPAAPDKDADEKAYNDFLNRGPAAAQEIANKAVEAALRKRDEAEQTKTVDKAKRAMWRSESALVQKNPQAREMLGAFAQLAKNDPSLRARVLAIATGEDDSVTDLAQWCVDYATTVREFEQHPTLESYNAAQRAKWEAEAKTQASGGQAQAGGAPQRRTPLTLVGNGGGGTSETPQTSEEQSLKKAFNY